jgi:hypothetical protein
VARRTGRSAGATRGRKSSSPEYGQASAKQYQQQTRDRLRNQAIRTWIIRLIIVGVLVFAGKTWGPSLVARVTQKGREAKSELQKSRQGVQKANDRRSGADFDPNE